MKPIVLSMTAFGPFADVQIIDFRELGERTFFLIHGPTGSGKTTILDGICYALFGDSSGGERDGRQMRSHHADPATLTEVQFDFELGDKRYRVRRVPEQLRKALRGDREVKQNLSADLWRIEGGQGAETELPLATGASKVNDAIVGLLGFDSQQFRQVIMLPQGKFREFLISSTQEREKILQTLFGTELYKRIEDALRVSARQLEQEAGTVRTRRQTLLEQAEVADEAALAERHQQQTAALKTCEATEQSAAATALAAEKILSEARLIAARFAELDQAALAFNTKAGEQSAWDAKRLQLAAARRAASVRPVEKALLEANHELDVETARGAKLAAELIDAHNLQKNAAAAAEREKAKAPERDQLVARIAELDGLAEKVASLATARREHAIAEQAYGQAAAAQKKAQDEHQRALEAVRKLAEETQRLQIAVAGLDGLKARAAQLKTQHEQKVALTLLQKEAALSAAAVASHPARVKKAEADLAAAHANREATHRAWIAGQAARLASELAEGEACPVCGAHDHPAPAHAGSATVLDDTLEAAQQAVTRAQDTLRNAEKAAASAMEKQRLLDTRIQDASVALGEAALLSPEELKAQADAAAKALLLAEQSATALKTHAGLIGAAEQASKTAEQAVATTTQIASETQRKLQELSGQIKERAAAVPAALADPATLKAAKDAATNTLNTLKGALDTATAAASQSVAGLATITARIDESEKSRQRLLAQQQGKAAEFEQALKTTQFDSPENYRAAQIADDAIATLEAAITTFDGSLKAASERQARALVETRDLARPDLPALTAAHDTAKAHHLTAGKAAQDARGALKVSAGFVESLRKLAESFQTLEARHAILRQVANVATGNNEHRMSFQRYVLATLLEEVLAAATLRLRVMSRGRYEMRRRIEALDQRAAAGLDLEVFDHYTGMARAASTLSGGESFLASLALALGLSDVVQSYAGGIRLDAIFVDEGFGTLDPEALDFAIRALKDLQQAGRMVGIISHVAELKEWIDARLELKASQRGSVARFTTGAGVV